jgi:hypothetical protein
MTGDTHAEVPHQQDAETLEGGAGGESDKSGAEAATHARSIGLSTLAMRSSSTPPHHIETASSASSSPSSTYWIAWAIRRRSAGLLVA